MALSTAELLALNAAAGVVAQQAVNNFTPAGAVGDLAGPVSARYSAAFTNNNPNSFATDPSTLRLQAAGLYAGGANNNLMPGMNVNPMMMNSAEQDWRIKITVANWNMFTDSTTDLLSPLVRTNGVIFPYTPSISVSHNARWNEQALTHSNYKNYFYEGSEVMPITISGDFSVQNIEEGKYLLAVIYFFRTVTKMFFGKDENQGGVPSGNPPPLVFLDGFGDYYFPHVSCVVQNFTHTMPNDVDYIQVPVSPSGIPSLATYSRQTVRLPTLSQISVQVQPVYSRKNVYENFNLKKFAQGQLLRGRGGFI